MWKRVVAGVSRLLGYCRPDDRKEPEEKSSLPGLIDAAMTLPPRKKDELAAETVQLCTRMREILEQQHSALEGDPEVGLLYTAVDVQCRTALYWHARKDRKAPLDLTWEGWARCLADSIAELERIAVFESKHQRGLSSRKAQVCACLAETTQQLAWLTTDQGVATYWSTQHLMLFSSRTRI